MLSTSNVGNYDVVKFGNGDWLVVESGRNWKEPQHTHTFAFDTETFAYLDGKKMSQEAIFEALYDVEMADKRQRLSTSVWAWQCYDEYNGFFMTNSFDKWLLYQCRCGYGNGWCYNAKFDFSQIDWMLLAEQKDRWTRHKRTGRRGESKGQAWTYESCHNDMGARYAYKLWIPYKHKDRHTYTHAVEFRDFMNLFVGGLARCLESLDVEDNDEVTKAMEERGIAKYMEGKSTIVVMMSRDCILPSRSTIPKSKRKATGNVIVSEKKRT